MLVLQVLTDPSNSRLWLCFREPVWDKNRISHWLQSKKVHPTDWALAPATVCTISHAVVKRLVERQNYNLRDMHLPFLGSQERLFALVLPSIWIPY